MWTGRRGDDSDDEALRAEVWIAPSETHRKPHLENNDPENVVGLTLSSLLQWWGIWKGELSSMASPDESREMLQILNSWAERQQGLRLTKKVRPYAFSTFCMHEEEVCAMFRQLDTYLSEFERRPRPPSVLAVVSSSELISKCLAFAGAHTAGAATCASNYLRRVASSEDVWQPLLSYQWPGCQCLVRDSMKSRDFFARRVRLARNARQRDQLRDAWYGAHPDLAVEASKYSILVELVALQQILICGLFDLEFHETDAESDSILCASLGIEHSERLRAFLIAPLVSQNEISLRISITLVRKEDEKMLVIGDNLEYTFIGNDCINFEIGSSLVTNEVDDVLEVLSKDTFLSFALQRRTEDSFCHKVELTGVRPYLHNSSQGLAHESEEIPARIRLGMAGLGRRRRNGDDELEPAMILSAWEYLAMWG